jgi:tetratricopeptide (TPR) repeat protein
VSDPQRELDRGQDCERRGDLAAAAAHYRAAAELATDEPATASEALRRAAVMLHLQSDWVGALATAEQAARVAEAAGLRDPYGAALNAAGIVHQARGDFAAARQTFEQVLGLAASDRVRGIALQNLGAIAAQGGSWELARRRFEQSRRCFQRAGYALGEAFAVNNYGRAALDHGNHRLAAELLGEARAFAARHGDAGLHALASLNYAEAIFGLGQRLEAAELAEQALEVFTATGNTWRRVEAMRLLGDLARAGGDQPEAERRWREGLALAEQIGAAVEADSLRQRLANETPPAR